MEDRVIIGTPIIPDQRIIINQPVVAGNEVKAFPIMKGEKGDTGPEGKSALELFQINIGNPLATLEEYEAYLIATPNASLEMAISELETKVEEGYFTPLVEPKPETKTWWVGGVNTNQPYMVTIEGSIDPQNYVHEQSTPSTIWIVNHPMNKYPSVTIVDSAGTQVVGEVTYLSLSRVQILFSAGFSGKAILN